MKWMHLTLYSANKFQNSIIMLKAYTYILSMKWNTIACMQS